MAYRRYPLGHMRYTQRGIDGTPRTTGERADGDNISVGEGDEMSAAAAPSGEPLKIPLPNEAEFTEETRHAKKRRKEPSILSIIRSRIGVEEIILLGLIFLLLDEGIEDDFLLIILVYILLTGKK